MAYEPDERVYSCVQSWQTCTWGENDFDLYFSDCHNFSDFLKCTLYTVHVCVKNANSIFSHDFISIKIQIKIIMFPEVQNFLYKSNRQTYIALGP